MRASLGAEWDALCDALRDSRRRVGAEGAPDTPRDRAEGYRYLTRFLAAGIAQCVAHADPDYPVFGRMIDATMPWGLDNPDTLYLYAAVRGGARYRIWGNRGSAHHIDVQVNSGHFSQGEISGWATIDSIDGFGLATGADGAFELTLAEGAASGNRLRLAADAGFVLVRQTFADWERERPADLWIEREGAEWPAPAPGEAEIAARLARLRDWVVSGGALWDRMSRGLLAMPANTLVVHHAAAAGARAGARGQAYGMGNFHCEPDAAVIVELRPPRCHHWSLSLANFWWEAVEYASRQSSLNQHQARIDPDGCVRAVIAQRDPGVPNWLDAAGNPRGTLAARFLLADEAPTPALRVVPLARVRDELPPGTPRVDPDTRAATLARRRRAVLRRFRW